MYHPVINLMFEAATAAPTDALRRKSVEVQKAKTAVEDIMYETCMFVDKAVNDTHTNRQVQDEVLAVALSRARLASDNVRVALFLQVIANGDLEVKLNVLQTTSAH